MSLHSGAREERRKEGKGRKGIADDRICGFLTERNYLEALTWPVNAIEEEEEEEKEVVEK